MHSFYSAECASQPDPETFGLFRPSFSGLVSDLGGGGKDRLKALDRL